MRRLFYEFDLKANIGGLGFPSKHPIVTILLICEMLWNAKIGRTKENVPHTSNKKKLRID